MRKYDGILYAPPAYWKLSEAARKELCNGCGTGGWKGRLVSDTVFGMCITEACDIHDYMYVASKPNFNDKDSADRTFLNNMVRILNAQKDTLINKILYDFRLSRIHKYYKAVSMFGGPAFWSSHNISSFQPSGLDIITEKETA